MAVTSQLMRKLVLPPKIETDRPLLEAQVRYFSTDADSRYQLINNFGADDLPAMARLNALVEERLRGELSSPVSSASRGRPSPARRRP